MKLDDLIADDSRTSGTLRDLLRETLGSRAEIVEWTVTNRRDDYLVVMVRARRPARHLLVKLAGPTAQYAWPYERTAFVHRLVRAQTSVPIPEVVAVDVSAQRWPWRYLITTVLPGQEWATVRPTIDARELADCHRQLGDAVGQLHAIRFPEFGEIGADGTVAGAGSCATALAARTRTLIREPRLRELFLSIVEERSDLLAGVQGASLCHDDLHHYNILFRHRRGRWQLAAILDFDKAWAGPAESDLARLDIWRGMASPALWSAYREHQTVSAGYERRRPLYQLLWCLEYGRPTAEHLEVTDQVCIALGLSAVRCREISDLLAEGAR